VVSGGYYRLFSNNVVSFSRNVVLRGRYSQRMWSQNSGCFLGQAIYVLGPLRSARRHSGAWTLLPSKRCSPRTPGTLDVPCSRPILVATMVSVCWAFLGTGRPSRSDPRPRDSKYGDSLLLLGHNSNLERLERNPNLILLSQQHFPTSGKKQAIITMMLPPGGHHLDGDHGRSYAGTLHSACCRRRAVIGVCQSDGHLQVGQLASRCYRRWHDVGGSRAGENRCRGSFGSRQTPADA